MRSQIYHYNTLDNFLPDGTDYAQPRPVGSVLINTSSSASGISTGTWVNIGTATIGTTTVYYWERTA